MTTDRQTDRQTKTNNNKTNKAISCVIAIFSMMTLSSILRQTFNHDRGPCTVCVVWTRTAWTTVGL